ncbi:MAG: CRISPR system precrRNA processing endoribonuclease RAMP protein Cas6, partial [bacterium]
SIYYYPYVLAAIHKMLTDIGIGSSRCKFSINKIKVNGKNIIQNGDFDISEIEPIEFDLTNIISENYNMAIEIDESFKICERTIDEISNNKLNIFDKSYENQNNRQQKKELKKIKLKFLTPLRIKQNNCLVRDMIDLDKLLQAIYFRICEIEGEERQYLNYKPYYKILSKNIKFEDYSRYSNRQHIKMLFGGLVGYIEIDDLDNTSYNLFKILEIIGIGKSTAFGLGKIYVECL